MKVLEDRKKIYGDFEDVAEISQKLKSVMFNVYEHADPTVREALDMILHKLARTASAKDGWKVIDNVTDIIGYSKLWEKHISDLPGSIKTVVSYEELKKTLKETDKTSTEDIPPVITNEEVDEILEEVDKTSTKEILQSVGNEGVSEFLEETERLRTKKIVGYC
jgi:hypothetical protein